MAPRAALIAVAAASLVAACAPQGLVEREVAAGDVPVRFAYRGLRPEGAKYEGADDPRRGTTVRRVTYAGADEFAIFDLMQTLGDAVFSRQPAKTYMRGMLRPDAKVTWDGAGDIPAARQTSWQGFRLDDPGGDLACVGLRRSLREHVEAAFGDYSQSLLVGFYCREGEEPLGEDEIRAIAQALQA
jgi:hypothetical protein